MCVDYWFFVVGRWLLCVVSCCLFFFFFFFVGCWLTLVARICLLVGSWVLCVECCDVYWLLFEVVCCVLIILFVGWRLAVGDRSLAFAIFVSC